MDSEWVMAVRRLCLETPKNHKKRKKKPDTDKPDTETCDTNNAKKLCVKKCVAKKMLKRMCSRPEPAQGFNYNVLQFKLGTLDCSIAPQKWRVGSACSGMLVSQLPPVQTPTLRSWY